MLRSIIRFIKNQKVSLVKTLLINFRALPFNQAIKFPIHVYSGTILKSIGSIRIEAPIERGMIRIGVHNFYATGQFQLINSGTIVFRGRCLLNGGSCICNTGLIDIGSETMICENITILITHKLTIGKSGRITFGTVISDTDFHSVVNIYSSVCKRSFLPITIGDYAWIGNRTTITKGVKIPDFTIVSSTSYLNKDYSNIEPYSLLAGSPAKVVASGIRRIYNSDSCKKITDYFNQHPGEQNYKVESVDSWDGFCMGGDEFLYTH